MSKGEGEKENERKNQRFFNQKVFSNDLRMALAPRVHFFGQGVLCFSPKLSLSLSRFKVVITPPLRELPPPLIGYSFLSMQIRASGFVCRIGRSCSLAELREIKRHDEQSG